ncbi:MAG: hypothetical protein IH867_03400 [Chloroflexi bacterium]|nr:hypothetical protein [Chloroflexota bacterium]
MPISPVDSFDISDVVSDIPKADLHVHAEAGPRLHRLLAHTSDESPTDWRKWADQLMLETPAGMPRLEKLTSGLITADEDAKPRNFLARVIDVLREEANAGAIYTETRFGRGTVLRPDFIELFRQAENTVRIEHPSFVAEPLATLFVGPDSVETERLVEACLRAATEGLAGVDFIPQPYDQDADWTTAYAWAERLADSGLGITIHAGEFAAANLEAAIRAPGVRRIGHGVFATMDERLLDQVADSGVAIECCLTSNVILGAVDNYESHPIFAFIEAGIPVTLNTDNPVRFSTTIASEYEIAHQLGLSKVELLNVTRSAVEHAFTTSDRREKLVAQLNSAVGDGAVSESR